MTDGQFNMIMSGSVTVPVMIGAIRFNFLSLGLKSFYFMLVTGMLVEIVSRVLIINHYSTLFLFCFYTIIETSALLYFYSRLIRIEAWISVGLFLLITMLMVAESVWNPEGYNSLSVTLESIIVIGLSIVLLVLYSTGKQVSRTVIVINGALLFYFISNIIYFLMANHIAERNTLITMVRAHAVTNAISNLTFASGLWMIRM